jgi:flagellar export protein FliJ
MKRFTFSLERVLAVRRVQADRERLALDHLRLELHHLHEHQRSLRQQTRSHAEALAEPGAIHSASHLAQVEQFAAFARYEDQRLAGQAAGLQRQIDDQQWRLQQAELQCKLLENLEAKQRAVWQESAGRELDELAADLFTAKWSRDRRHQSTRG